MTTLPIGLIRRSRPAPTLAGGHPFGRLPGGLPMQTFIVEATNRPGELARVSDLIAQRGINLEAFSIGYGTHGALALLGHDEKGLKDALTAEGITFKQF